MIGHYRKKPVVIEAWQFTRGAEAAAIAGWCAGTVVKAATGRHIAFITVPTLEGDMRADIGDWIICGVKNEFYPCKPDIFDATYEPLLPTSVTAWESPTEEPELERRTLLGKVWDRQSQPEDERGEM